jgi:hypothetical protein
MILINYFHEAFAVSVHLHQNKKETRLRDEAKACFFFTQY